MTTWSQDFTVKSNARRAARKAGIDASKVAAIVKAGKTLYRYPLESEKPKAAPKTPAKKAAKKTKVPAKKPAKKWKSSTDYIRDFKSAPAAAISKADRGLKFVAVAALLRRPGGASITEVCKATDWLPHTARARISVDVSKLLAKGEIIQRRREEGVSHYAILKDGEQLEMPGVTEGA